MPILHLIRTSAYQHNDLAQCLQIFDPQQDSLVLIDEGVYNVDHPLLKDVSSEQLYIIDTHWQARGIIGELNAHNITLTEFNQLIFQYDNVVTWQ